MGVASGGVSVSLDAVYSMFNTACVMIVVVVVLVVEVVVVLVMFDASCLLACGVSMPTLRCCRYALGSIMGPTLGLWMVQGMGVQLTYTLFGCGIAAFR